MTRSTAGRPAPPVALEAAFPGKYVSLTSYRRDGTAVATPVWFVVDGRRLLVDTDPGSFKVKRIRRNPAVTVAPCTASGRPRGDAVSARAEILPEAELGRVQALIGRKYRTDRIFILPIYRLVQRLRGTPTGSGEVALAITPLDEMPSAGGRSPTV